MKFLPLFYQLNNKRCLVVGGGVVASRRAKLLQQAGMIVDVISPVVSSELIEIVQKSEGIINTVLFDEMLITQSYSLLLAMTNSNDVNRAVYDYAKQQGIPVNVASDQSLCDFIFPAIVDREPLTIAISNSGCSPVLTRLLKQQIECLIPTAYADLASFVGQYRDRVKQIVSHSKKRVTFWENTLQGPIATAIFSGKPKLAEHLMEANLSSPELLSTAQLPPQGEVYLIGAGPGDPELLTLKAFRLLQQADVVLHDRLVSSDILALIKPGVELLYVGKRRDKHSVPQDGINQLLVDYAKQGRRVVRLKGGDPFIFGRGGEEIEKLAEEKIPFQVVPGVSAANGCSAYSGIPLTHRDYAQSVQFVTGQLQNGTIDLNWLELIAPGKTLVFYMGLKSLPIICQSLIENGMKSDMPVALIEKGTTIDQRVIVSTLQTLPQDLITQTIESPSLFIVGEVVQLSRKLEWFNESNNLIDKIKGKDEKENV